jgi:hypothetical protein
MRGASLYRIGGVPAQAGRWDFEPACPNQGILRGPSAAPMTTAPPDPSPPAGLLRRLAAGAGAQGLSSAVLLAGQLLSVPVLLGAWGADTYADWLVLSAAAGLLELAVGLMLVYF